MVTPPPGKFATTIQDVASADGTFPADVFAERVGAWAHAVRTALAGPRGE